MGAVFFFFWTEGLESFFFFVSVALTLTLLDAFVRVSFLILLVLIWYSTGGGLLFGKPFGWGGRTIGWPEAFRGAGGGMAGRSGTGLGMEDG